MSTITPTPTAANSGMTFWSFHVYLLEKWPYATLIFYLVLLGTLIYVLWFFYSIKKK